MNRPKAITRSNSSPEFDFVAGFFGQGRAQVRYLSTTMTFREADTALTLVSELPGQSGIDWQIEELFQRDIDWDRVERRIVPYLRRFEAPRFFNSISVMLLPKRGSMVESVGQGVWSPPELHDADGFKRVEHIGPITCGYWNDWREYTDSGANIGRVVWNVEEVVAVAIDGQHRLAAIKQMAGTSYAERVPVLLVVPRPLTSETRGPQSLVGSTGQLALTRSLFIDLNKHAIRVTRARQILLDDNDVVARCVRAVVGPRLVVGDGELSEGRIPLTLVDWHSDGAKFDAGPYLTTILGLDWMVAACLETKPLDDPLDYDELEKHLRRIQSTLGISLDAAMKRLNAARASDTPFEFRVKSTDAGDNEVALIANSFNRAWGAALVVLLSKLRPYSDFIFERKDRSKTLSPSFSVWYVAYNEALDSRTEQSRYRLRKINDEINGPLNPDASSVVFEGAVADFTARKRQSPLAFTVVFQRALLTALRKFVIAFKAEDVLQLSGVSEHRSQTVSETVKYGVVRAHAATRLVDSINRMPSRFYDIQGNVNAAKIGFPGFWRSSFIREDGTIDFTKSAADRASEMLLAIGVLGEIQRVDPSTRIDDLLKDEIGKNPLVGVLQRCSKRLQKSIVSRLGADGDIQDEKARQEVAQRFVYDRFKLIHDSLKG